MTGPESPQPPATGAAIYWPNGTRLYAKPPVWLHSDGYAVIDLAPGVHIQAETTEQADALIVAGAEAKEFLLAAQLTPCADTGPHFPHERCPGVARAPLCPAQTPTATGHSVHRCTLGAGHDGPHEARGTGNPPVTWTRAIPVTYELPPAPGDGVEPYCTICDEPVNTDRAQYTGLLTHEGGADPGHDVELGWRPRVTLASELARSLRDSVGHVTGAQA